jgi:hypothetical protein
VLCVIPVPIVRWALVGVAFGLSGWFLSANIYPILATVSPTPFQEKSPANAQTNVYFQAEAKATRLIIILLALLHLGLAITFKVLFFSYYVVDKIGVDIPIPGGDAGTGANPVRRRF